MPKKSRFDPQAAGIEQGFTAEGDAACLEAVRTPVMHLAAAAADLEATLTSLTQQASSQCKPCLTHRLPPSLLETSYNRCGADAEFVSNVELPIAVNYCA